MAVTTGQPVAQNPAYRLTPHFSFRTHHCAILHRYSAQMTTTTDPARHAHLDTTAVLSLLLCCFLWGLNQVSIKAAMPEVPVLMQLAIRSVVAFALLLGWMRWRGIRWSFTDGTGWPGLLCGLLFAVEFGLAFVGLQYTTAARGVVFINTSPFIVALVLAAAHQSERLALLQLGGLLVAFGSIALAFGEGTAGGAWKGDLMILGAAVLWGLTTVVIRLSVLRSAASEVTLAYQLGVAAVLSPIAAVASGSAWPAHWSGLAVGVLFYQSVIVTFASYLLWFWLLTRYPATKVQAFVFLSPVFGTLCAGWLLGEAITPALVGALVGVGIGLAMLNRV
jgi:drug/metabolite transporter (DMT)-like permease